MSTTETGTETAPDLAHPALAPYLATLPPDPTLARLTDALTEAWSAVAAIGAAGDGR